MERQVLFFLNIKNEQFSAEKQHVKNISLADNPWLSNFVGDLLSLYGCLHAKYIYTEVQRLGIAAYCTG